MAPDFVNAFYFHAQALGRYSQEISITKALAQGIGGRVKASLDRTLKLEPNHAEAHIALAVGLEVGRIDVGCLVGGGSARFS